MLGSGEIPRRTTEILNGLHESEANELIRSRIFINCFLELTGGRPFDIDAVCRSGDLIFVAEFKRKYPSRSGQFGIDGHLITLAKMLPPAHPLYHFILRDLRGYAGKHSDPSEALIDPNDEGPNFKWYGLQLAPEVLEKCRRSMVTYGEDSGQKGGRREQLGIPESMFVPLTVSRNQIDSSVLSVRQV